MYILPWLGKNWKYSIMCIYFWKMAFWKTLKFNNIFWCIETYSFLNIHVRCNYANPVHGVATICHQVHWLRWGHPSLFHAVTSLLIWYKMFCVRGISHRLIWMKIISMFSVYAQSRTHSRFNWKFFVVFNIQPFCSVVCGDHRHPQTLAEMYRKMGICYGFNSVAARVKYPGFM